MVATGQVSRLAMAAGTLLATAFFCHCESQRTVKSVETNFSFDQQMWGGQGNNDSGKLRKKFAESGYTIAEDGSIVADDPNLFEGEEARGVGERFDKKRARFGTREARTKQFRTPEYLKRQEFAGVSEARESGIDARESEFGESRDRAAGRLFDRDSSESTELDVFGTGRFRGEDGAFATAEDTVGAEAVENAAAAEGTPQRAGYSANAALSMGDVKRMLEPGTYARAKREDE